jgi:hypothetical protein
MNLDQLNDTRVAKALSKLASTDERQAELSHDLKYTEEKIKQATAHAFLLATGTVAEREAKAQIDEKRNEAYLEWLEAYKALKILDNERNQEIRITELFQTLSANRRKGSL